MCFLGPTNLALHKPTWQSSTAYAGDSSRAVDGNTYSAYNSRSCTQTLNDEKPCWIVDLQSKYIIKHVQITGSDGVNGYGKHRFTQFIECTYSEYLVTAVLITNIIASKDDSNTLRS